MMNLKTTLRLGVAGILIILALVLYDEMSDSHARQTFEQKVSRLGRATAINDIVVEIRCPKGFWCGDRAHVIFDSQEIFLVVKQWDVNKRRRINEVLTVGTKIFKEQNNDTVFLWHGGARYAYLIVTK